MNNITFGDENVGYYETVAGGAGAGPTWHGRSGVHTHMTNTRITDPEVRSVGSSEIHSFVVDFREALPCGARDVQIA